MPALELGAVPPQSCTWLHSKPCLEAIHSDYKDLRWVAEGFETCLCIAAWLMGHLMSSVSPSTGSVDLGREGQEGMGPCKLPHGVQLSVS